MFKNAAPFVTAAFLATAPSVVLAQQNTLSMPAAMDDTFLAKTKAYKANQEPAIIRADQEKSAAEKLLQLHKRFGRSPNIVVILLDDVGWGDPGVYGGGTTTGAATPNIDRLAKDGLQLMNTYSQPSCSPTRASLLTGQLPVRTGLLRPLLPGEGSKGKGIDAKATLARKLKDAGYETRAVGKWHLGEFKEAQPQNVGFDHYYGILTSSDDYTAFREPWRNPELLLDPARKSFSEKSETLAIVEGDSGKEAKPVFPIDMNSIRLVDQKLTEHAIDFIDSSRSSKKPFFLYFAPRCCHNDNYPHPDFVGKSLAKYPYKDALVEIDYRIGQIHAALEKAGQLENTLIFIASDNGPFVEAFPDTGFTPFRGAKGTSYEGGVRVPGIAYWKNTIKPGRVSAGLFDVMDIYSTSLALAGATDRIPTDRFLDSIDQSSFLIADQGNSRRRAIYYWANNAFMGVRVAEYKLLVKDFIFEHKDSWPQQSPFQGHTLTSLYGGKLYNLLIDPKEEHAMLPLKQTQAPVLGEIAQEHLKTFKKYPPAISIQ